MTEEEKERIRKEATGEAQMANRIYNLERDISSIQKKMVEEGEERKVERRFFFGAVWSALAFFAMRIFEFIAAGGTMK